MTDDQHASRGREIDALRDAVDALKESHTLIQDLLRTRAQESRSQMTMHREPFAQTWLGIAIQLFVVAVLILLTLAL